MLENASQVAVFEYLSFDDAWDGILRKWFTQGLQFPIKKLPRAIITPNDSVALLIKEHLLKNDIPVLGVRFLTPGTLRHHLLNSYKYSETLELRENLHLLMKVVARELGANPVAQAAEIEPDQFVRLADLIEMTGWDASVINNIHAKTLIEKYIEKKNHCGLVTGERMTNRLYEESSSDPYPAFSDLLVFGFRSKHWSSYKLLLSAVRSSNPATVCLLTQDSTRVIDQGWLGSWEEEFGPSERIVPASEEKPYSYLSYYFDDPSPEKRNVETNQLPEIYIAEDILREAEVIVARIAQALATEDLVRLGVVFPNQTSSIAREVSRLLEEEEIAHYNHLGYLGGSHIRQQLFESWVAWQSTPRLAKFLVFLDQLVNEGLLTFLQFNSFNKHAQRALQNILTDELPIILSYLKCGRWDASIEVLLNEWILLPEEALFSEYIMLSQNALVQIAWPEDIELVKQRAGPLLESLENRIKKSDFLAWLSSITKPLGRVASYIGEHKYSLIHLITEEEAILQTWSHLILSGLNQGEWPSEKPQVIFLNDARIAELNQESLIQGNQGEGHLAIKQGLSLLASSTDQYAIGKNNFITLLGAPSKKLILTAHAKDPTKSKDVPISEFLEKTYWISEGHLLDAVSIDLICKNTQQWIEGYSSKNYLNHPPIKEIVRAYNARRDGNKPFDEYSFCFKESNKDAFNLPAKVWEDVLTTPERAWFNHILGVRKSEIPLGKSLHALAKGTWIHSWLTLDTHYGAKKISTADWAMHVSDNADGVFRSVERSFSHANRSVPDIWKANWHEARRTAVNLCHSLSSISDILYLFSEYTIPEVVSKVVEIPLKGRIDLIAYGISHLEDKSHPLWIIDFKTGSSGALSQNRLKKGIGLQLALYALAFNFGGFDDIDLSIVQAHTTLSKQIHLREVLECRELLDAINLIYQTGKLGLRESMERSYGGGYSFPLSTLKIESDVIKNKFRLTHPSLAL